MSLNVTIYRSPSISVVLDAAPLERPAVVRERPSGVAQLIVLAGLSALVMFSVLAFGSTDQWAITILEVGSALLFFFWMWSQISSGQLRPHVNLLYAPMVLFGLIIVAQVLFGLSAYAHITRIELWKYAAYGSLFLLANHFESAAAHKLLKILAVFGSLMALFALVQYLTYDGKIYWYWQALPGSFGPYVDHSHYAGLMEMLTPIPFAMALTDTSRGRQLLWSVAGILMAASIFLSGSRGGMVAFTVEMVLFAGLFITHGSRRATWALLAAMCLAIGTFVFWIDDGRVLKQLDSLSEPLTNSGLISRVEIARDLPRMVRDRPVVGWGLGVFPVVYPKYRSFSTDLIVNQAHNDYLQALVETGILGFSCVLWYIVNLYRRGMRNLRANCGQATAAVLGPLVGCTGILVHSLSDFNLHIAANAALFFVLCGIVTQ